MNNPKWKLRKKYFLQKHQKNKIFVNKFSQRGTKVYTLKTMKTILKILKKQMKDSLCS